MANSNWIQKITDHADLIGETLPGVPIVEISGDNRVLIENHNGVIAYSREQICAKVQYGTVTICGKYLEFTRMTQELLVVSGDIEGISIQRRTKA